MKFTYGSFLKTNNKGTNQTALMRSLVCTCVVRKLLNTGFLSSRPMLKRLSNVVAIIHEYVYFTEHAVNVM